MVTINFTLSDNLNLSYDGYRTNDYVFSTAANAATIEVRLKVNSGEGSLYLDNVELKEAIQIDQIYLDGETTLSVGIPPPAPQRILQKTIPIFLSTGLHWMKP